MLENSCEGTKFGISVIVQRVEKRRRSSIEKKLRNRSRDYIVYIV